VEAADLLPQQQALNELEAFLGQVLEKEQKRAEILSSRLNARRETLRLVKKKGG